MRVVSLLFLVLIVGAIGAVAFIPNVRNMVFKTAQQGLKWAEGYGPAETPHKAMEQFRKAVKDRQYETAADYVSGPYAEQLTRAHKGARSLGSVIDRIKEYAKEKGLMSDKSRAYLYFLDAFPGNFSVKGDPTKSGDEKAIGFFLLESVGDMKAPDNKDQKLDLKMFNNNLRPLAFNDAAGIELVKEGKGDDVSWKLKFPLTDIQTRGISYFVDHYNTYETALTKFQQELTNQRFGTPAEFEAELRRALVGSAPQ